MRNSPPVPMPVSASDRRSKNEDPRPPAVATVVSARPSPRRTPRGYSRPVAAVTSRHQRVAVWPLIPLLGSDTAAAYGHGQSRCRRQVATFAFGYHVSVPGTVEIESQHEIDTSAAVPGTGPRVRSALEWARPPIAPRHNLLLFLVPCSLLPGPGRAGETC